MLQREKVKSGIVELVVTPRIVRPVPPSVMVVPFIVVGSVVIEGTFIKVGPVVIVSPIVVFGSVEMVGLVIMVAIIVFWEIPTPIPPPREGLRVAGELIVGVEMPVERPVVHALVIVGVIIAELHAMLLLMVVLVTADALEFANIWCGNLEVLIVHATVLELVNPVDFPVKIPEHHVFKSEEVVVSPEVAMLPVAVIKIHEVRPVEVHVEVVIVGPIEVDSMSSHFIEFELVKVACCEVCKSTEIESIEVNVSEMAPSKVVVMKVPIVVAIK